MVPALLGDLADIAGLLEYPLCLADHLLTDRGQADVAFAAFEQAHPQLVLQLAHRHAERRLTDMARLRRTPEMAFPRNGNDILQFIEGHIWGNSLTNPG